MPLPRRPDPVHERLAALAPAASGWVPAPPSDEVADALAVGPPAPGRGRHRAAGADAAGAPAGALVPSTLRGGRWRVTGRAAVGAVLALAVLGAALALRASTPGEGATLVPARTTVETTPPPGPTAVPTGAAGPVGPAGAAPEAVGELVVHVVGQVGAPGLVRVPAGSRVADALAAAGGASDGADLARVNLARPVVDGEQLLVPLPGEVVVAPPGGPGAGGGGARGGQAGSGAGGRVDLNQADLPALDALDGIGPVLAQRILDWRQEHGRFSSVEELGEVTGIGDALLARLRETVTV